MKKHETLINSVELYQEDCRDILDILPENSVHCIITSPPYWGLRDYGVVEQIGLETTIEEYISEIVLVFRKARRVLREDGTCWINLGDVYNSQNGFHRGEKYMDGGKPRTTEYPDRTGSGLKTKDLCGIPWRIALSLQKDGWWLRQDIIWYKPNPLPESVTDRCTKAHEYIFMLSKSEKYYFNSEAIKEKATNRKSGNKTHKGVTEYESSDTEEHRTKGGLLNIAATELRNKRSVWTIASEPFSGAHFAVFPTKLVEPCILAGCRKGGTVLDPFAGSGTVGLVSHQLGRKSILIEINCEYIEIIKNRLNDGLNSFEEKEYIEFEKDRRASVRDKIMEI